MKCTIRNYQHYFKILILLTIAAMSKNVVAGEENKSKMMAPVRLSADMISGIGLETVPWGEEARLAKWSHLFTGKELSVSVFESTPKVIGSPGPSKNRVRNYPYDQFVIVLSGKSVLTDETGNEQTFTAGDYFVVPKGFTGTWEEFGVYRELIVIEEEAVRTRKLEIEKIE